MGVTVVSQYRHIFPTDITFMLPPMLNSAEIYSTIVGLYDLDGSSTSNVNFSTHPLYLSPDISIGASVEAEASQVGFRPVMCDKTNPAESKVEYCFGYAFTQRDSFESLSSSGIYVCPFALVDAHDEYTFKTEFECERLDHSYIDIPYIKVFDISSQVVTGSFVLTKKAVFTQKETSYLFIESWSYEINQEYEVPDIAYMENDLQFTEKQTFSVNNVVLDLSDHYWAYSPKLFAVMDLPHVAFTPEIVHQGKHADCVLYGKSLGWTDNEQITNSNPNIAVSGYYSADTSYVYPNIEFDELDTYVLPNINGLFDLEYLNPDSSVCLAESYNVWDGVYVFEYDFGSLVDASCDTKVPAYKDITGSAVQGHTAKPEVHLYKSDCSFDLNNTESGGFVQYNVESSIPVAVSYQALSIAPSRKYNPKDLATSPEFNSTKVHEYFLVTEFDFDDPPLDDSMALDVNIVLPNIVTGNVIGWVDESSHVVLDTVRLDEDVKSFKVVGEVGEVNIDEQKEFVSIETSDEAAFQLNSINHLDDIDNVMVSLTSVVSAECVQRF